MDDGTVIGEHKADFSRIYDRPGPGPYYTTLARLDYSIPELGVPVIDAVHAAGRGGPILDVCCSYGINAMLMRHRVGFAEFAQHFAAQNGAAQNGAGQNGVADGNGAPARNGAASGNGAGTPDESAVDADRRYLAQRLIRPDLQVLGLDSSAPAIAYAVEAGILADGWAENLEEHDPSPQLAAGIADVSTIACTGGVGYVTATTFDRILSAITAPDQLTIAMFVLRVFDAADILATFERYGLVTEQLPDVTFKQRRFIDVDEQQAALHDVALRGVDPAGREAAGWYHADCFVARPPAKADVPLATLLAGRLPDNS